MALSYVHVAWVRRGGEHALSHDDEHMMRRAGGRVQDAQVEVVVDRRESSFLCGVATR